LPISLVSINREHAEHSQHSQYLQVAASSRKGTFLCGSFGWNRRSHTVCASSPGNQAESFSVGFVAKFTQLSAPAFRITSLDLDFS
jgi:hypothetical protein